MRGEKNKKHVSSFAFWFESQIKTWKSNKLVIKFHILCERPWQICWRSCWRMKEGSLPSITWSATPDQMFVFEFGLWCHNVTWWHSRASTFCGSGETLHHSVHTHTPRLHAHITCMSMKHHMLTCWRRPPLCSWIEKNTIIKAHRLT